MLLEAAIEFLGGPARVVLIMSIGAVLQSIAYTGLWKENKELKKRLNE